MHEAARVHRGIERRGGVASGGGRAATNWLLTPARAVVNWLTSIFPRVDSIDFNMLRQLDPVDYSLAVRLNKKPANSWRWEIYCAGKSTPVRRSAGHFTTMGAATRAGKEALSQFLDRSIY
jgi:hypothetical protein